MIKVGDLIPIGGSGNVKRSEVLKGKTYSSDEGTDLVGTMPNNGAISKIITSQGGKIYIPEGYHNGNGYVKAQFPNLIADNIKKGINVGGVVGSYITQPSLKVVKISSPLASYRADRTETQSFYNGFSGIPIAMFIKSMYAAENSATVSNLILFNTELEPYIYKSVTGGDYGDSRTSIEAMADRVEVIFRNDEYESKPFGVWAQILYLVN